MREWKFGVATAGNKPNLCASEWLAAADDQPADRARVFLSLSPHRRDGNSPGDAGMRKMLTPDG